jgi:uncharacterized membrane protein (UPF0127 family)
MRLSALTSVAVLACSAQGEQSAKAAAPAIPAPAATTTTPSRLVDPLSEEYQPKPLPRGRVTLTDAFGLKRSVEVEIAADESSRNRGLMWRKELKEGSGMLFVFPASEGEVQHSFYMRNTLIPLDMIFIGKNLDVVGIVPQTEPKSWTPRGVGRPSRYVLEVPGGWSEKIGLKPGAKVELPALERNY